MELSDGLWYREMMPEDARAVEQVEVACFSMPWSRESFWQEAANEQTFYLLALWGERIVGYGGTYILSGESQITNVAVHPDFRRKGVAMGLMKGLISESVARGASAMTLEVRCSNEAAIALYEKFGFRSAGLRRRYYIDNGEDAIIMWNTNISKFA